ncbi:hypothetical protein Tco_0661420 [Tanacetum coccineum]
MNSLRAIQSQLKFLIETLQDFGNMPIFKRTFSQDLDLLENHLTKQIMSQTDCKTTLTKLRTTFENAFSSEIKAPLNVDSLKVDLVVIHNTCSENEESNSEIASSKSIKECSLNSKTKDVHAIKYMMSKEKERCMAYFQSLHSHLQVLSKGDLKGTRIEQGFKREFMSLFGQDVDTFTRTMLLNVDQLQKQLSKDEFQKDGSMTAFWVVNNQFQKFIDSKFTLDYDSQMTDTYFVEYTGIEVQHFRDTLLQHLGNVKKSVAKRTHHQRQYDRRVNKRLMQTQKSKIDTGKALDNDVVVMESNGTKSEVQDDNSRSGNDTDADDADIRPIYDEEPMAEVQLTAECNIFAIGQQHTEQPEIIVEGRVDQYPKTCQVKSPMLDSSPDNQTTEYSKQSLESENILLKKTVAQFQKDFSRMEAHCIALELKYQNQSLKSGQHGQILNETSNKAKIEKEIDVLETMNIELEHSVATLRKENETLKQHYKDFYDSGKVTQHYFPKRRESASTKPDHMIAYSSSRNSYKNMPRFSSNDMVHNHYLDEARKKSQERDTNSKSNVMHTASPQNTTKGHRFSPNKTFAVYEKTSPRSDLRWKPTGRIFKSIGLRWIPTGKLFNSCTSKVDSKPSHGLNVDIPNIYECKQTLSADEIVTTSNELNLLFSQMFDELLNGTTQVVSKSSAVTTADASNQCQQQHTIPSTSTTVAVDTPPLNIQTTSETTSQAPT